MLADLEKKIADFIRANELFGRPGKILLAVSGGGDSTALLYAMCALKSEGLWGGELIAVHMNHQLRGGEADADEDFVVEQTGRLKVPVLTKRLDVAGYARKNKLSTETAGRKLRLEILLDIARAENCSVVATGHQKCDNAETIIQRLARGTGVRGLAGIWPARMFADGICFVRPLLCVTRDQIIEYLAQRGLKWRQDRTNLDCKYRRNFIRHRLLPALQEKNHGSLVEQLFALSQSAQRFYRLVCDAADNAWPQLALLRGDKVLLDVKRLLDQPPAVKVELVRRALTAIGSGERDLTQAHYEKILTLIERNISGKKIELPNGFVAQREYGGLVFAPADISSESCENGSKSIKAEIPGLIKFGDYLIESAVFDAPIATDKFKAGKSNFIEYFDFDKVKLPLTVRFRQPGDRFWPLGLAEQKKVGKFLTAAKVPQQMRKKALIVADSEKIVWVWPLRISEQARITDQTRKVLQLQITDGGSDHEAGDQVTIDKTATLGEDTDKTHLKNKERKT